MTTRLERRDPGTTTSGRPRSNLLGAWTIDRAHSSIAFTSRALRLWTITGRRHCSGVIHLDKLPPVGVIRFQQPSGLPVLTMALDPASLETEAADLNAMLSGPDSGAVRRHRWWTLHSESLEILPSGAWRVMATLTAHGTPGLVELRLEVDPEQSRRGWLVLRGRGVLDRRALAIGRRAWRLDPTVRLDLAVRATRVETRTSTESHEADLHHQHATLSRLLDRLAHKHELVHEIPAREGDQLPTVKEVVAQLAINPNTVLKAYRELEYEGLVAARRRLAGRARPAASGAAALAGQGPPGRSGRGEHRGVVHDHLSDRRSGDIA